MDRQTTEYYNSDVPKLQLKYNSTSPEYMNLFQRFFDPGTSVLDIGCGSGRDILR